MWRRCAFWSGAVLIAVALGALPATTIVPSYLDGSVRYGYVEGGPEPQVVESVDTPGPRRLVLRQEACPWRTNFCKVWQVGETRPQSPPADMTTSPT